MEVGVHEGDGKVLVEIIYQCKDNCAKCTSNLDCQECLQSYKLLDNACYLDCPDGSRQVSNNQCEKCTISDCNKCPSSANTCETCKSGTNLLIENGITKCVTNCNPGQIALDGKCVQCKNECSTCSISKDFCDSCKDNKFLFEGNCHSNCADFNVESNNEYYEQDNDKKECKNCLDNHCIDCSSNFNQCVKCSPLYFFDQETGKCLIKPTSGSFAALKIYNDFQKNTNKRIINNLEQSQKVITVSNCNFDVNDDSKSSVYYINGKEGSNIEVKNCNFNGISDRKKKYIDGKDYNKGSSQLSIISCDFHYKSNELKRNSLRIVAFILTIFLVTAVFFGQKLNFNQHEIDNLEI